MPHAAIENSLFAPLQPDGDKNLPLLNIQGMTMVGMEIVLMFTSVPRTSVGGVMSHTQPASTGAAWRCR